MCHIEERLWTIFTVDSTFRIGRGCLGNQLIFGYAQVGVQGCEGVKTVGCISGDGVQAGNLLAVVGGLVVLDGVV